MIQRRICLVPCRYGVSVDVWSIGVVAYILLCGLPPFYAGTTAELLKVIKVADFKFDTIEWDSISDTGEARKGKPFFFYTIFC